MRRWLPVLCLLWQAALGQEYSCEFLGKDYDRYLNTQFKLRPQHSSLDHMFFDDMNHEGRQIGAKVSFPLPDVRYRTCADSLIGRTFRVAQIFRNEQVPIFFSSVSSYPVMMLVDMVSEDTLYYRYDPYSMYRFPFVVQGLSDEEDVYCHQIQRKELTIGSGWYYHTPSRGAVSEVPISIHRTVQPEHSETFSIMLRCYGMRPHSRVRGVTVFLADGTRISRNDAVVSVSTTDRGYEYRASIKLSAEELNRLKQERIVKHRLYIYDQAVSVQFGHRLQMYARCISKIY